MPIGGPIANTRAYVVRGAGVLAPIGVPGELWLGGEGLARGYLNRPGHTAERFVADPFGPPGGRLYRTGDLARRRPDGRLEFLGRIDQQVKVRGYRIDPGEVTAALAAHPSVRQAAVVPRDDLPGGRALIAYLAGEPRPADDELRALVRDKVPEYMHPAAFVWMDGLPLNDNGKLDRRALPAPTFDIGGDDPRTPTELRVREAWRQVLGQREFRRDSKFFEVGGNSMLVATLLDRIRELFPGTDLSLVDLFEFTTCEQIAAVLDRGRRAGTGPHDPGALDI
jgi:hypothetical protein